MKILTFVDLHGNKDALSILKFKARMADLIICAGDISVFENNLSSLVKEIAKFKKPVLMLHGNHEKVSSLKEECSLYDNIFFLHKGIYELNDILFIGYGGGGFSERSPGFNSFVEKIKPFLKKKNVLITHGPPYGVTIDYIHNSHVGNKDFLNFIKKVQPNLVVCGHIHETAGKQDIIGKTKIINPGPSGKIIEI
jgi:Icc-related predicted phosphoesterase